MQQFEYGKRLRESRAVIRALGLNTWNSVYLPPPEPGMKSWDEGVAIGQFTAWFERRVAECRISPSLCQFIAQKLEQIAADALARGWPVPKIQPAGGGQEPPKALPPPQPGDGQEPPS